MTDDVRCRVTDERLSLDPLIDHVSDPAAGAVATFLGVSRRSSNDRANVERPVDTLWYEAYGPMAEKRLNAVCDEAVERFGAIRAACHHRTGEVPVGEASVAIAVSSGHRPEAFEACRWIIDEIKRSVPIWKRERFADDGEEWVVGYDGREADADT